MLKVKKICKKCKKECFIWRDGCCKTCSPNKPLKSSNKPILGKKSIKKISENGKAAKELKKAYNEQMREFFISIWNKRPHKSEISGKYLGEEPKSTFFHHILPKSRYKDYAFIEDNIIILTFEEHQIVEASPLFYEEINKRRDKLLGI